MPPPPSLAPFRSLGKLETKLQKAIGEYNTLSRSHKALQNSAANLKVALGREESVAARARLALDPSLLGPDLTRELEALTRAVSGRGRRPVGSRAGSGEGIFEDGSESILSTWRVASFQEAGIALSSPC